MNMVIPKWVPVIGIEKINLNEELEIGTDKFSIETFNELSKVREKNEDGIMEINQEKMVLFMRYTNKFITALGVQLQDFLADAAAQMGIHAVRIAVKENLTREVIKKINKYMGYRFLTKASSKGVVNVMDIIPVVGGIVSGFNNV